MTVEPLLFKKPLKNKTAVDDEYYTAFVSTLWYCVKKVITLFCLMDYDIFKNHSHSEFCTDA